jgi:hypothetical protein
MMRLKIDCEGEDCGCGVDAWMDGGVEVESCRVIHELYL